MKLPLALTACVLALSVGPAVADYKKEHKYGDLRVTIKSEDNGRFRISAEARREDDKIEGRFGGEVKDSWLEDIDGDRWPEVIVIARTNYGGGSARASIWTWDGRRLQPRYVPSLDSYWQRYYRGGDRYSLERGRYGQQLERRFRVGSRDKDTTTVVLDLRRGRWIGTERPPGWGYGGNNWGGPGAWRP